MPDPQMILKALAQGGWEDHSTAESVSLAMEKVSELEVCVRLLDTTCFSLGGFEAGSWEKAGN